MGNYSMGDCSIGGCSIGGGSIGRYAIRGISHRRFDVSIVQVVYYA